MWRSGQPCVGVEPQKFDRFVSGFSKVNIGVRREAIGTQDIRLAGMLYAQLRADKSKARALNLAPDLFFTGKVRVRLAKLHGKNFDGDNTLDGGETVSTVEEAVSDMSPVPACSRIRKRRRSGRRSRRRGNQRGYG